MALRALLTPGLSRYERYLRTAHSSDSLAICADTFLGAPDADALDENLIPALSTGRTRINSSDLVCRGSQQTSNYTEYPMLSVSAGAYIALRYLENRHVTLRQLQIGKPGSGGTVLSYATARPSETEKLLDILSWDHNAASGA